MRGYVQKELVARYPSLYKRPYDFVKGTGDDGSFLPLNVEKRTESTNSTTLIYCVCSDSRMNTALAAKYAKEAVFIGFLSDRNNVCVPKNHLFICVCHKLQMGEEDINGAGEAADSVYHWQRSTDPIHMAIIMNMEQSRAYEPGRCKILHLKL